jgi:hypothetical protein
VTCDGWVFPDVIAAEYGLRWFSVPTDAFSTFLSVTIRERRVDTSGFTSGLLDNNNVAVLVLTVKVGDRSGLWAELITSLVLGPVCITEADETLLEAVCLEHGESRAKTQIVDGSTWSVDCERGVDGDSEWDGTSLSTVDDERDVVRGKRAGGGCLRESRDEIGVFSLVDGVFGENTSLIGWLSSCWPAEVCASIAGIVFSLLTDSVSVAAAAGTAVAATAAGLETILVNNGLQ